MKKVWLNAPDPCVSNIGANARRTGSGSQRDPTSVAMIVDLETDPSGSNIGANERRSGTGSQQDPTSVAMRDDFTPRATQSRSMEISTLIARRARTMVRSRYSLDV